MSQSDQNCIQEPFQGHQSGPKGIQMEAQAPPRASQERPKSSKEVQSEPKASQGEAKVSPRRPKETPKGTLKDTKMVSKRRPGPL